MDTLNELLCTPAPSGTRGRAVAGVSERTRSGAGGQANANATNDSEHNEPSHAPTLHDAIERHGIPLPLEAIYAANTISRADFDRLFGNGRGSTHSGRIDAPAYIEHMATAIDGALIAPCEDWVRRVANAEAGWAWVKSVPIERGMAIALRMIEATQLGGKVARLSQLASLCRRAPLYGAGSKEAIASGWAELPTLALAVSHPDEHDASALEALALLVARRRDEMLPTIFVSDSTGAELFAPSGRPKDEARACALVASAIKDGLTGFSGDNSRKPNVIDLSGRL